MKIGRNDPYPCESGKKYKKCCYLNNNNINTEINLKESDADDCEDDLLSSSEKPRHSKKSQHWVPRFIFA